MDITKEESTHPVVVPGALEEPLAAVLRVLAPGAIDQRQPRHLIHRRGRGPRRAMQAERRPYGAGEQGETSGVDRWSVTAELLVHRLI